jgi:hypothetical protein
MNNAKAELSAVQGQLRSVQPRISPRPAVRAGDEIRDFFKRGDRGQYEGGAADRNSPSIPTWDLPERPQIVRTPRQQARRVAMMQVVGTIVAGCFVLLVTAAHHKSSGDIGKQAVNVQQVDSHVAAQSPAKPSLQYAQQPKELLLPPPAPATAPNAPPTVAVAPNAVPTPSAAPALVRELPPPVNVAAAPREVAVAPVATPTSVSMPVLSKVAVAAPVSHTAAKVTPTLIARAKPVQHVEPVRPPPVVSTSHTAAPKRAVAAFPDD